MKIAFAFISIITFSFSAFLFAEAKQEEKVEQLIFPEQKKAEGSWGKESDQVEAFQEMKIIDDLSEENTRAKLEEARNYFNSSLAIFKASEKAVKDKRETAMKEPKTEKFDWQKKARDTDMDRELKRMSLEGRKKAIVELVKGMAALDRIENPEAVASQVYLELKASLYREYIKHQFRLKNFNQSSEMLRRYINIAPQYEKESEPHKLLAICYESVEKQASKYKVDKENLQPDQAIDEERLQDYKSLKNQHLLRYAELAYGKESQQYKRIQKKLSK